MKALWAVMVGLLGWVGVAVAQTPTPMSQEQLYKQIQSQFPDNVVGAITPFKLREVTQNIVASFPELPSVNVMDYGAVADCSGPTDLAFNLAFQALGPRGGRIVVPPGQYCFAGRITFSLPNAVYGFSIEGAGKNATTLHWGAANGGIHITYGSPQNAVKLEGMSFTTAQLGGGNAVWVQYLGELHDPSSTEATVIQDVTIRGANTPQDNNPGTQYWDIGILVDMVSNVHVVDTYILGTTARTNGAGMWVRGLQSPSICTAPESPCYQVVVNLTRVTMNWVGTGFIYGRYVQGVSMSQVNITGGTTGIYSFPNEDGTLAQLTVVGSQITVFGTAIFTQKWITGVIIIGNVFIVPLYGIVLGETDDFIIQGNTIGAWTADATGIRVAGTRAGSQGLIVGNTFGGFTTNPAVHLTSTAANVLVEGNTWRGNTTNVLDEGTGNTVVIQQGAWVASTPTPVCDGGGDMTNPAVFLRIKKVGMVAHYTASLLMDSAGTCVGPVSIPTGLAMPASLPFAGASSVPGTTGATVLNGTLSIATPTPVTVSGTVEIVSP